MDSDRSTAVAIRSVSIHPNLNRHAYSSYGFFLLPWPGRPNPKVSLACRCFYYIPLQNGGDCIPFFLSLSPFQPIWPRNPHHRVLRARPLDADNDDLLFHFPLHLFAFLVFFTAEIFFENLTRNRFRVIVYVCNNAQIL